MDALAGGGAAGGLVGQLDFLLIVFGALSQF